jgi:cob(I)alamin adenosyltransferase
MTDLPALKKLSGTVETIVKLAEGIPTYSQEELNKAEDKLRNEFQVIEAHLFYVGQEFYNAAQARRIQLRRESIYSVQNAVADVKEEDGATRSSGDTGDGVGTDKPSVVEQQSDTKAKRPSRQSKSKK